MTNSQNARHMHNTSRAVVLIVVTSSKKQTKKEKGFVRDVRFTNATN